MIGVATIDWQAWFSSARSWLDHELFHIGETGFSLGTLLKLLAYVIAVVATARWVRRALNQRVFPRMNLEVGVAYALANIVFYLAVTLGLLIGIQSFGVNLSTLTVLFGALGVGIGFGLQEIAANFISGLILLIERPIQVGDRIQIEDLHARVVSVGMRATEVRTNDGIVVIVPNREFISQRVTNWSRGGDHIRIHIPIGVAYGSDVELVRKALLEAAADVPELLKTPNPSVRLSGFGDSSIDFELLGWTRDMLQQRGEFISRVNFAIHAALKRHGIEIPFPQRDLHLRSAVGLRVDSPAATFDPAGSPSG